MRVENLLKQLKREFIKVKILQSLLDGLLFFLIANLILFLLNVSIIDIGGDVVTVFANISVTVRVLILGSLTLFIAGASFYYRMREYEVEIFERQNPELREVLRTARDNLDHQNIVSQALFEDLMGRARRVRSESIIPARVIIYKMLAVGLLSFLTVMSGLANFQLQGSTDLLRTPDNIPGLGQEQGGSGGNETLQLKDGSDIYGDAQEIDASDLNLGFNVTGEGRAGDERFDPTETPPEEELRLDSTFESDTEDLELAREYSVAVREIG